MTAAGRPPALTPARTTLIADRVRSTGNYSEAARTAGISISILRRWRRIGEAVNDPDHPDHPLEPSAHEKRCAVLVAAVTQAEAEWATATRAQIALAGTRPSSRTTRITKQVLNKEGGVVTLTEERTEALPPDWRALGFLLDRHSPPRTPVELTGPDGGPVELELGARAASVRAALEALRGGEPPAE